MNYTKQWQEIQSQLDNGNLKSLQPELDKILKAAEKDKKTDQWIRAFLLRSKVVLVTEGDEEIILSIIDELRKKKESINTPAKNIIAFYLAEFFNSYYKFNRYDIHHRTELQEETSNDFRLWSKERFKKEIGSLYLESIENHEKLQISEVEDWSVLLQGNKSYRELRPSLYELLNFSYLAYLSNLDNYYFNWENSGGNSKQIQVKIDSIYKSLAQFQKKQGNIGGYLLTKLEQYKMHYITDEVSKESFEKYKNNLVELSKKYPENPLNSEVLFALARYYHKDYDFQIPFNHENIPSDKSNLQVLKYLKQIINKYPNTLAYDKAIKLKDDVQKVTIEASIPLEYPDMHIPLKLTYSNTDIVYLRIYKAGIYEVDYNFPIDRVKNLNKEEFANFIQQNSPIVEQNFDLKNPKDYEEHSTLLPLPKLNYGRYYVVLSTNPDFSYTSDKVIVKRMVLSNYELSFRENNTAKNEFQILNHWTGEPYSNKEISFYNRVNNKLVKGETVKTNSMGQLKIDTKKLTDSYNTYYDFFLKLPDEDLYREVHDYHYQNSKETKTEIEFFTDRSIYRPGQVVYFKGIVYSKGANKSEILKGQKTKIGLYDANNQLLSELDVVSNEFGSFKGNFVLPSGGLTGRYHIKSNLVQYSSKYFSVEEYKRPKFKVELDSLSDSYKLGDKVLVSGKAQGFSGNFIDNATTNIKVYEEEFFPYDRWWRRSDRKLIYSKELKTNAKGEFQFNFETFAHEHNKKARAFSYVIQVDVTDSNGETRTGEKTIRIGDMPYYISLITDEILNLNNSESEIKLGVRDLSNQKQKGEATIEIFRLQEMEKVFANVDTQVEYQSLSKEEFKSKFPYLAYDGENELKNLKTTKSVYRKNVEIDGDKSLNINELNLEPGTYKIISKKQFSDTDSLFVEKYFRTYRPSKTEVPSGITLAKSENKNTFSVGETYELQLISSLPQAFANVEIYKDDEPIISQNLSFGGVSSKIQIPITENMEGGLQGLIYISHQTENKAIPISINVPRKSKEINIKTSTFRDKLEPGSKEKWQFTLSDSENKSVMAEMLAGMYDLSLDEFQKHNWSFAPFYTVNKYLQWRQKSNYNNYFYDLGFNNTNIGFSSPSFESLNSFGFTNLYATAEYDELSYIMLLNEETPIPPADSPPPPAPPATVRMKNEKGVVARIAALAPETFQEEKTQELQNIIPRKNLKETAFFYPDLKTDEDGNITVEFTVPESLTEWRFMAFAHNDKMQFGQYENHAQTQKDFMVFPNPPRFLREGDEVVFSSKLVNLSDAAQSGTARLEILDAFTNQPINEQFDNTNNSQTFNLAQNESKSLDWKLKVPKGISALIYRVVAGNQKFSDGVEAALPILTNRMLVTETLPISIRKGETKNFTFTELKNNSETKDNLNLTFEFTENPVWQAVMALPYLQEYPYECSEQIFSRLFANSLGAKIISDNPKIKAVFEAWNKSAGLKSPLEKNQELKNILLEESPWVQAAQNETEQQKRIALLFETNNLMRDQNRALDKLRENQNSDGGFPWFKGGKSNIYIGTHLLIGFGQFKTLGLTNNRSDIAAMSFPLIDYLDKEMLSELRNEKLKDFYKSKLFMQYLYARSYHLDDVPLSNELSEFRDKNLTYHIDNHTNIGLYQQAQLAMLLHRFHNEDAALRVLKTIKEKSVDSAEKGMYWKENVAGWYWCQAPVETQALVIEAFNEITPKDTDIESMKVWLMVNKKTNAWDSTKATTMAIYTLLSSGENWINAASDVQIDFGGKSITELKPTIKKQMGDGYFKTVWSGNEITPNLGEISIQKESPGISFGGLYYQYFEDLDKIKTHEGGIEMKQKLYLKTIVNGKEVLKEIDEKTILAVGDLLTVRLEIKADRDLEFVHLKGMRASGLEPVNVLSSYRWKGGLGYYESTRDAATNFFFDYLPSGVHVFEFDARANNAGNYSMGISQLQSMYAPEFSAHSQGERIKIKR